MWLPVKALQRLVQPLEKYFSVGEKKYFCLFFDPVLIFLIHESVAAAALLLAMKIKLFRFETVD